MNRSPLRVFLLIPFALACFALSPQARAVCQEGCLTNQNTVLGDDALLNNTGANNTAVGFDALFSNTTASSNIALSFQAGLNLRDGSNNIYIANAGGPSSESATIRIGTTDVQNATFIAGINGVTVPNGVGVIVGIDGHLGTVV